MDHCPFSGAPCPLPKVYHITDILGNEVQQMHLCQNCFMKQYQQKIHSEVVQFINCLLSEQRRLLNKKCKTCGFTLEDMAKLARLGCPDCYDSFQDELKTVIHRCQDGGTQHVGKRPKNYDKYVEAKEAKLDIEEQIRLLRLKMAKAVEVENYEVAGVLKKKIEELQAKLIH